MKIVLLMDTATDITARHGAKSIIMHHAWSAAEVANEDHVQHLAGTKTGVYCARWTICYLESNSSTNMAKSL